MTLITAPNERCYNDLMFYLGRRMVQIATKVKTCSVGKSILYFNYDDEIVAIETPSKKEIELTHNMDEETSSGLIDILNKEKVTA
jgi:hypothetical protein